MNNSIKVFYKIETIILIIFHIDAEIKVNMFDPTVETQQALLKKRVKLYSQKTYKKYHDSKVKNGIFLKIYIKITKNKKGK